jgi:uncharacterized protein (TIGR03437 family)
LVALAVVLPAQGQSLRPDWRHIGNSAIELGLPAPATGPINRVWYSANGAGLLVTTVSGRTFETADFENWTLSQAAPPERATVPVPPRLPETSVQLVRTDGQPARLYALGTNAYRSDDGGLSWMNLTAYRNTPILGSGLRDLAVSPRNPDEITIAAATGVWRSLDGGQSWDGLNRSLPNLPAVRITSLAAGASGIRLSVSGVEAESQEVEWAPGEKAAWRPVSNASLAMNAAARENYSRLTGLRVKAYAAAGSYLYLGSADGWLWSSSDQGTTWNKQRVSSATSIEMLFVDPSEPRTALAAAANRSAGRILRTTNGGLFWDDLSGNLPAGPAHSVTADLRTGAVYAATEAGIFFTFANLSAPAPATAWIPLNAGLPEAAATDVRLDPAGNQLFVALDGYGVYAALAPHRMRELQLVSAADYRQRAAAPGSLLSVLGGKVTSARSGDQSVPVLAATDSESQIQVPFEADGSGLSLLLETATGRTAAGLPLLKTSPAIFVDRDNTPLLLNADSGVLLDAMAPVRAGGRLQILATGLGAVKPDWPTGLAGPLENPPAVVAPVHVYLDRTPLEVTRAILAPGYIGFYLVEVQLPEMVNAGAGELFIEAGGQESNRVRVWLGQ